MSDTLKHALSALSEDVKIVDLHGRVMRGSRRITMRNRAVGSLAVVAAIAAVTVAFTVVRPAPMPPPAETPSPIISGSMAPSPNPSASTAPRVDLRNATFEVPAFPGNIGCPAGTRTFVDGIARLTIDSELQIDPDAPDVAEVDGKPGYEALVPIHCQRPERIDHQLLALKIAGDGRFSPLGFVLPERAEFEAWEVSVTNRVVRVTVLRKGGSALDRQVHGYSYQDGSFQQVSGPAGFPELITNVREVDFENATLLLSFVAGGQQVDGSVKLVSGQGTATMALYDIADAPAYSRPRRGTATVNVTVEDVVYVEADQGDFDQNGAAVVLLTVRREGQDSIQIVNGYSRDPHADDPLQRSGLIVDTGIAGVDEIEGIQASGVDIKVRVSLDGQSQVWTYDNQQGGVWLKIS